jgi:hypothetical protein
VGEKCRKPRVGSARVPWESTLAALSALRRPLAAGAVLGDVLRLSPVRRFAGPAGVKSMTIAKPLVFKGETTLPSS